MSNVWKYFKVLQRDNKKAECLICPDDVPQATKLIVRGKDCKTFSTKPLWNHLAGKHPKSFTEAKSRSADCEVVELNNGATTTLTQPKLPNVLKNKENWSLEETRSKVITTAICKSSTLYSYGNANLNN